MTYTVYTFGLTDLQKYWIVELAICTVKPFDSTCTCQCDLHVLYMHLVLLRILGIYVHVLVITVLSFFLLHVEWRE